MESFAEGIQRLSIQFVPFFMAVIFHEFAHGFVAHRWGDDTAKNAGRLTLNPIPHVDPIGTILFPLINMAAGTSFLFGWARPVPINPSRFKKFRAGLFWVSFAGPGMNFLLALFSAIVFYGMQLWVPHDFYLFEPLTGMTLAAIPLNIALGVFNLIPLPPLDGSKIVEAFLPYEAARKYESIAQYSFFILIGLLMTGAFRVLEFPIRLGTLLVLDSVAIAFGLPKVALW